MEYKCSRTQEATPDHASIRPKVHGMWGEKIHLRHLQEDPKLKLGIERKEQHTWLVA